MGLTVEAEQRVQRYVHGAWSQDKSSISAHKTMSMTGLMPVIRLKKNLFKKCLIQNVEDPGSIAHADILFLCNPNGQL